MKNILSSLNESEKKRILEMHKNASKKQYLSEAIIEKDITTPQLVKVLQTSFINQEKKGIKQPVLLSGQYYYKCDPVSPEDMFYQGEVFYFIPQYIANDVSLPILSSGRELGGEAGTFSIGGDTKLGQGNIKINVGNLGFGDRVNWQKAAPMINQRMNQLPLEILQKMYAADPRKTNMDQSINKFKANPNFKTMSPLLTGNAKTFFVG